ncbi:FAD-dependent monooxygenase [Burkholderia multivorans]|uniref:FAD-dependent monooxygenase n=1 Tax=Burkholderia multivorans TaxID=87883 RepID=UPI0021BFB967|nr:FAD-dependent monooxygenase [Burkholderia multivorans]MDR8760110.1 6-methylpretetramide 4-monooxygenase [Burkholderia multivorans]MDR8767486.1 6-methylpretetramide 4-monooxygenase [Burkholderia multivorans]MDR8771899.1 6-methylpretetramide 4-monooxygenase [Burkholderia multivorans]MDR8790902.1 6-methylpretetramide 4-monooxygenase [Burkholderia multivorans]MDR8796870.1 6-methylpretetramide 4-monooxygenase [Burkholderia multivorans]
MADTLLDIPPVLIVGAGPTGLAAAMSLARARVPVRVIDKLAAPAPYSRAIGIQARTLELLEQHRAVEPFLALGHRAHAAALHADGRVIARLDFDPLQTRYPYLLLLDQSVTERLLAEHLAELGVTIERGVTLVECDAGGASLDVTLRDAGGRDERFSPSYLIAADGAHSTVRHLLGIGFAGRAFEQTFLLADFAAIPDWPEDEIHLFTTPDGIAGLFPLGSGRYRLVADRPPVGDVSPDSPPPSLADCEAVVRARIGASIAPSDLAWSSYFRLHSRMVERLRHGRVFFAGDAAHIHSPAGAQGMNTGVQEAFNLGWKLARVLAGGAPDRLLDTYHTERHPIERDVLRQTSLVTQIVEADHGAMKLLRDHLVPLLVSLGPLRDAVRRSVSELGVQYRKSPLTLERVLDGGPRAGERAPDALLHVIDGPLGQAPGTARLYDVHDPASLTLLLLEAPSSTGLDDVSPLAADAQALIQRLERIMPGAVRAWRVTDVEGDGADTLVQAYGRSRPAFYLLRPDGYIAARGRASSDANALLRHCETWFAGVPSPSA